MYTMSTYRAQSGTGKTATFSVSILQCLDTQVRETQALVLSPTRELAGQIQKVNHIISKNHNAGNSILYINFMVNVARDYNDSSTFLSFLSGNFGLGRLHECTVSLLYRRNKYR